MSTIQINDLLLGATEEAVQKVRLNKRYARLRVIVPDPVGREYSEQFKDALRVAVHSDKAFKITGKTNERLERQADRAQAFDNIKSGNFSMLPLGMRNRVLRKLLFGYDDKWTLKDEGYVRGMEGLLPKEDGSKREWVSLGQEEILGLLKQEKHLYGYIHVEMMDLVYEDIDPDEEDDLADAEDDEEEADTDPPAKATRTSKRSSPPSAPPGSGDA